jgi:DNA-directed RNA polymerase subunit RPC12/RpoP
MAFCANCGHNISDQALACPQCGHPTQVQLRPAKDKTVAVLLAVFLSFWTWLYTYQADAWKFWVGLGLGAGTFVLLFLAIPLFPFAGFGVWIWSIVDVSVKPREFYVNYPAVT